MVGPPTKIEFSIKVKLPGDLRSPFCFLLQKVGDSFSTPWTDTGELGVTGGIPNPWILNGLFNKCFCDPLIHTDEKARPAFHIIY